MDFTAACTVVYGGGDSFCKYLCFLLRVDSLEEI